MEYVLITNDGRSLKITGEVDIEALATKANAQEVLVIKIGTKVMLKHLVAAVAEISAIELGVHNLCVSVARQNLYTTVATEDVENLLLKAESDLNKNAFVVVNGVLINRAHYMSMETLETEHLEG